MNVQSKLPAGLRAGLKVAAIVPQTLDDVAQIARMAVSSGLSSNADTAAIIIMQGLEVGLPPTAALQSIYIKDGRMLIFGDAVPALLWAAGFDIEQTVEGEGAKRTATCVITRPNGKIITRTFSVGDAMRAGLWDRREMVDGRPNESTWFRFGDRMLGFRALGFAVKDGASDVTRGLYVREEYEDNKPLAIDGGKMQSLPARAQVVTDFDIPDDVVAAVDTGNSEWSADAAMRQIEKAKRDGKIPGVIEIEFKSDLARMNADERSQALDVIHADLAAS